MLAKESKICLLQPMEYNCNTEIRLNDHTPKVVLPRLQWLGMAAYALVLEIMS
jgi:hypothetical protein